MVEQDSNSPDTAVGSSGERWRPNSTIDLKADEVRTEAATEAAAGETPAAAAAATESTAATSAHAPAAASGESVVETPRPSKGATDFASHDGPPLVPARGTGWSHVGAGAVGAV